jgi:SAM-dependent methyltransferase
MTSVTEHYEKHLAPVYSWMAGGLSKAVSRGEQELMDIGLANGDAKYAVDLGAGFGMHSIPLAHHGWNVLAIDFSTVLLTELRAHSQGVSITTAHDDLLNFTHHLSGVPEVVLCMGDTLTHLTDSSSVKSLIASAGRHLMSGGRFVIAFRDYTTVLEGSDRFMRVRGDESRIVTCFLEYAESSVQVYDILHERSQDTWSMSVSTYRKLRLKPGWVRDRLEECGFLVSVGAGLSGMVRLIAEKP